MHHGDMRAHIEDHDRGLQFDIARLVTRRSVIGLLAGGVGAGVLAACDSSSGSGGGSAGTTSRIETESAATTGTSEIPEETAGPFPGDGSNGPNVLAESGVVRQDISKSSGDASGVAEGLPATLDMRLLDVSGGGTALAGAAVYLWHCDREGRYSLYDPAVASENYLRGVQVSDRDGRMTFQTIFPGAYAGRWPHMHFEVYENLDAAASAATKLRTSQLALPQEICEQVYATEGYEQSVENLAQTSLASDSVFSDGYASQLAKTSGSVADGIALRLNVGV
jgi:protocatechuate 3,4-dioxygenase beta subunit